MKKVGLVSLGCCKNLVDSEMILKNFVNAGYEITNDPSAADVIVVNTCGFIQDSKQESINTIFEMAQYHKKLVITGCLSQRYYDTLKDLIPEVDLFIKIDDYHKFNSLMRTVDPEYSQKETGLDNLERVNSTNGFTSYIKIAEGCSNCCTYCAIPLIRGLIHSREMEDILNEAKKLASTGVKELVVIAQDTTKYGIDIYGKPRIEDLLKELLKIKEFAFIRLLYLYPDEISDELIDMFKSEPRLTPYFDIPIQHSETSVLKAMNRRGDKKLLANLFNKIKERVPNAILRTTIMVGFPGETDEDVENLVKFIQEVEFDHLGAFTYSREEDTVSYDFEDQIDEDIKNKRYDIVMKAQGHISYRKNKGHIGEIMDGIIVGVEKGKYLFRSYWNAPDDIDGKIIISSDQPLKIGELAKVKITNASIYDLAGEFISYNK